MILKFRVCHACRRIEHAADHTTHPKLPAKRRDSSPSWGAAPISDLGEACVFPSAKHLPLPLQNPARRRPAQLLVRPIDRDVVDPFSPSQSPWWTVSTRRNPGAPCGSGRRRSPIAIPAGMVRVNSLARCRYPTLCRRNRRSRRGSNADAVRDLYRAEAGQGGLKRRPPRPAPPPPLRRALSPKGSHPAQVYPISGSFCIRNDS
jgi:hypothetical protein